jgi:hypothetical protein
MKRTLLFVLALVAIPVGVDAQVTPSVSCADLSYPFIIELQYPDISVCVAAGMVLEPVRTKTCPIT